MSGVAKAAERRRKAADAALEAAVEAFMMFDSEGQGSVAKPRLAALIRKHTDYTEEEVVELLSEADTDADGRVDVKAFLKLLQAM